MAETKNKATKKKATPKTKADAAPETKAAKPKREKLPAAELMTFAVRLPKADSAKFHEAAGPGKASNVARRLLVAFANADESEFKAIVKDAREAQR